jgi:hypothetical protein
MTSAPTRAARHLAAILLLVAVAAAPLRVHAAPGTGPLASTNPGFCAEVQRRLAGTSLPVRNVVHEDFNAFVKSKPQIRPLETEQFVDYADGAHREPALVSCKTKSADHLLASYGPGSAKDDLSSCKALNGRIIIEAWAGLTPAEQAAAAWSPDRIMVDPDDTSFMGAYFIKPYVFLYLGDDGRPHVLAKSQVALWNDWRWKVMPERFRGTHYCRLIAPEYARGVMAGKVQVKPLPPSR